MGDKKYAAWEADRAAWVVEWRAQATQRLKRLEAAASDQGALLAKVAEMVSDPQFAKIFANLQWEAAREALKERQRMLAHLGAGLCDPDLSINEKARIERVARGLDPQDFNLLREAEQWGLRVGGQRTNEVSFFVLTASGCLAADTAEQVRAPQPQATGSDAAAWSTAVLVTPLGRAVLRALDTYIAPEVKDDV